jgi:hypothetical protein
MATAVNSEKTLTGDGFIPLIPPKMTRRSPGNSL